MSARCCPLCRQAAPPQLELAPLGFLKAHNRTAAILRLIRDVSPAGLTHEEISRVLRLSHATVSARLHDLRRRGDLVVSGRRATDSGRLASIFVAADRSDPDTAGLQPAPEAAP